MKLRDKQHTCTVFKRRSYNNDL